MRYQYTYDANEALSTVKLRKPIYGTETLHFQRKAAWTLKTNANRKRYVKTSEKRYPTEVTTDTSSNETTYSYTYHSSDALAVKLRTTTLPTVSTAHNGSGSAVTLKDYFEDTGLHTWHKDGSGSVSYTGYDVELNAADFKVVDLDTTDRPSGVPVPTGHHVQHVRRS